jgi:hypothetical protein
MNAPFRAIHADEVPDSLRAFAEFLKSNDFSPACAGCGMQSEADGFYIVNGGATYLCENCGARLAASKNDEIALSSKGNTAMGILGAFLGGAVGMIPWLILSLLGYVAAAGGLAMAFAAFYGYKLFHGKMNKKILIIVLVIGVVIAMTYMAAILSICLAYARDFHHLISLLRLLFVLPFHGSNASVIWQIIGQSYLYSALGILGWLFFLNRLLKSSQTKVTKMNP